MDINALLSPYARVEGGATVDQPLQAAVGDFLDAIEETEHVEQIDSSALAEEIAAFEQLDEVELAAIDEPVVTYIGKHRADMPADSVSPLVPVAATHRLSA